VRCWPGACRTRWTHRSACLRWKRPWRASAGLRSQRDAKHRRDNTDQGSQFTSAAFTATLAATGVRISMDGRGRWMDNVFIERLWRSLKYEDIYLKGYSDGHEAKAGIARWIEFYNFQRPHQALENRAPMAVWRTGVTGAFGEEAVDMTLLACEKLGQRCALPTSPQPQQQQTKVA
jgi:putative transposase